MSAHGRWCKAKAACVALCAAALFALAGCAASPQTTDVSLPQTEGFAEVREPSFEPPPPPPEPAPEPEPKPYLPQTAHLEALSGQQEPFAFASDPNDAAPPQLSDETRNALNAAAQTLTDQGADVGYLLFDLQTGRGVAANIDARVFVASSIKAPYALFLCETQFDTGDASIDDTLGESDLTLGSLVEAAVSESDNDAYHTLRNRFAGPAFGSWLDDLGIGNGFSREQFTPSYTARESALLWLRMYEYLNSDAPSAPWLRGLLENARVSFMRHAIGYGDVSVLSKAGWYDGEGENEDGFCDSGIVSENGHDYLLTVMTNLPYSAEAEYPFETLVSTLWDARAELATA